MLLAAAALLISACSPASAQQADVADRPVRAVATTGMIADLVKNVGGDRVQVTGLMGPGVDPHLYKASAGDVRTIANSDIVFYNGLHLEAGMAKVFERVADSRIQTVAVTDLIDREILLAPPEFKGQYDPHVWFDVSMWMQTVEVVRQALSELDPGSAALYARNAEAYLGELRQLNMYVTEQTKRLPADKRVIITAHDAFNYFGRAYGFEVRGLQGISTATEAGTADVSALADLITERQIPAVFIETSVPLRNIEAVQAAVQDRGFDLNIGGSLFSDAMGNPGTPEGTYIGMVRHNIDTIVSALLGQ
jgi:manganese/zinc/iron transport system substrate-binding protein